MASTAPDSDRPSIDPQRIDLQTIEHELRHKGSFCPLHWLLDCGLLPYGQYELWRQGQLDSLEPAIGCERGPLLALLQGARQLAQKLKLVAEPQHYHDWRPEHAGRELRLSRDRELTELLGQRWLRPQDAPQLDLFMDSGAASAENALIDQLADRHWAAAEEAYAAFCSIAPNNPGLGAYETLVLYGKHLAALPDVDAASAAEELSGLAEDIAPLARDLLGARARDYLAPAWQRLARGLPTAFDLTQPELHPSHAWAQIPDWPQVIASINAVADYREQPELLRRLAEALHRCQQAEASLLVWGYLFERFAEAAEDAVETQAHEGLRQLWQHFADSEEPHPPAHFAAWLLLQQPGLVHRLDGAEYPVPAGAAAAAVAELLRCRSRGEDEVAARTALQQLSPGLLRAYLQRRAP